MVRLFSSGSTICRFSNHDEVDKLLLDCSNADNEHRNPRLIELCGTSDALEALVAAHSEDNMSLRVLCLRIKQLPTKAEIAELFYQDELGRTTFAEANNAPVEVLESMLALGKPDAEKRNILDIADIHLRLPMHYIAEGHPDHAATKFLVRHHHPALLTQTNVNGIPLDYAIEFNKSPAVADLLRKITTAYKHGHFTGLIPLCGTSPTLQPLAVRTTDDVPLLVLCQCGSWEAVRKRIETIPTLNTCH